MIHAETLFRGRSVTLRHVVCRHGRGGPGEEEWSDEPGIGFPCAGVFRRHARRHEVLADPGQALFFHRREPYRISHPVDGGDATTVLPIYVYNLSFSFFRFGEGAATAILLLLALTVVAIGYLWLSRQEEASA